VSNPVADVNRLQQGRVGERGIAGFNHLPCQSGYVFGVAEGMGYYRKVGGVCYCGQFGGKAIATKQAGLPFFEFM